MFDIPPHSEMNHKTTAPSNHPNFSMSQGCRTHDIIHDVMPMSLGSNLMFVTDVFIFNALAKAWKQTQILSDEGWTLVPALYRQIPITEILRTRDI